MTPYPYPMPHQGNVGWVDTGLECLKNIVGDHMRTQHYVQNGPTNKKGDANVGLEGDYVGEGRVGRGEEEEPFQ